MNGGDIDFETWLVLEDHWDGKLPLQEKFTVLELDELWINFKQEYPQ